MATREEGATGREAVSAFAKIRSDTHWRLGAVGAQAVSGTLEWSWTVSFLFVHNERLHKRYQQRRNIHIRLNPPLARCTPGSPYAGEAFCAGNLTKCLPRLHQCFTRMPRYALRRRRYYRKRCTKTCLYILLNVPQLIVWTLSIFN